MKKILVFSTNYLPNIGGAELAIKEITDRLKEAEFELITPRLSPSQPAYEVLGRVTTHRVGLGFWGDKFLFPVLGLMKASRLHKEEKFEVMWAMMASQASIAAAFFKMKNRKIPLVLTLQEGDEEEHLYRYAFGSQTLYRIFIKPWHALIFDAADIISVISKHLEERARSMALSTPIVMVPNGVDLDRFKSSQNDAKKIRAEFGFTENNFVLITVSRLVKKNCVEDIVNAMALLPTQCKLLVVGEGELEEKLKKQVDALAIADRVHFVGGVSPEYIPKYLSASDAFVRPSRSEGFGNAFIEAMACGVPVIATPVGGIIDFIEDKKTGLFCGVNDPKDVALKVEVLMKDHDLRLDLIANGRQMVLQKYGWDAIAHKMETDVFIPALALKQERILIATGIYPPDIGGPAQYAENLTKVFQKKGYACNVLSFSKVQLPSGIRHFVYGIKLIPSIITSEWVLALDTFSAGLPAMFLANLFGKKIVIRIGGDFLWEQYIERTGESVVLPNFYKKHRMFTFKEKQIFRLTRFVLHRADYLVFNTSWQRDLWLEPYNLDKSKTAIVENYFGEKEKGELFAQKNFIFAGRPIRLKNADFLKESFDLAHQTVADIKLDMLTLPHDELLKRIASSYAVVLPSLSEVSPNFILEAIRFGKPFIATKYCGLYEELKEFGVWFDPRDKEALVSAFLVLADEAQYSQYCRKISEFKLSRTWDMVADDFITLFRKND